MSEYSEEDIWRAAEAMALVDEDDGCFEDVREWEAMEVWEQEAHGYPSNDYEQRDWWLKRAREAAYVFRGF